MTNLTTFNYLSDIRVVVMNGQPYFCGPDACAILELNNTGMAYIRLGEDEKINIRRTDINLSGRGRPMIFITMSGLFKLVLRSDKPEAVEFQDWVTRVVLPALFKDGMYVAGAEKVTTGEMSDDELAKSNVTLSDISFPNRGMVKEVMRSDAVLYGYTFGEP